jgi:hypothetical protein
MQQVVWTLSAVIPLSLTRTVIYRYLNLILYTVSEQWTNVQKKREESSVQYSNSVIAEPVRSVANDVVRAI